MDEATKYRLEGDISRLKMRAGSRSADPAQLAKDLGRDVSSVLETLVGEIAALSSKVAALEQAKARK
jgi:hypothetical protein